MQVLINAKAKKLVLAVSIAAMFGGAATSALADMEGLVEKLYQKGVLTEDEYNEMSAEARDERRDQAEKAGSSNDPDKLSGKFKDGFEWSSKDGQHGIQLNGRVQFDYRSSDLPNSIDGFELRRAYLGVKGKLYDKWTYELTSDLDRMRVEYAYLNYKWSDAVQARAGHFKFPYGFSQVTSSRFTDFMERSYTDDFEPGKDEGIAIHGEPKKNVLSYAVGYANGGGGRQNGSDTDKKDIVARGAVNFAPMVNFDKGVLHLGVDWRDGAFDVAGTEFDRTASGLEAVGAYGPFKIQSEFQTIDLSTDTAADPDFDIYYVSFLWLITGEQYVDSYSINGMKTIKPLKPLHMGGMGAWEFGAQYAELDADQSQKGSENVKSTTVGIKWIPETNMRFLLNWVKNDFESPITVGSTTVDSETQINARAQLYF